MFGFSLAELLMVALVALLLIKPKDLPEIAHFLGKIFFRSKKYFNELKERFDEIYTHEIIHRNISSNQSPPNTNK